MLATIRIRAANMEINAACFMANGSEVILIQFYQRVKFNPMVITLVQIVSQNKKLLAARINANKKISVAGLV